MNQYGSILFFSLYRPPNTPVSFWQRLNISIEKANDLCKQIIIVGVVNEHQ